MAVRKTYNVGVHIQGVCGVDGGVNADGNLFTFADAPTATPGYDFGLYQILTEKPDVLSSSVDFLTADYDVAQATFRLLELEELTGVLATQSGDEATHAVEADFSDAATTAQIAGPSLLSTGFYFIGDETIRVTGTTGATGAGWVEYNILRGQGLSPQQRHETGQLVLERVPNITGRPVRVFLLEEGVAEDVQYTGMLTKRQFSAGKGIVSLPSKETLHALKGAKIGDARQALTAKQGGRIRAYPDRFEGALKFNTDDPGFRHSFVDPNPGGLKQTVLQIGDHLVVAQQRFFAEHDDRLEILGDPEDKLFSGLTGDYDVELVGPKKFESLEESKPVYEPFVHGPEFSHLYESATPTNEGPADPGHGGTYRRHVLGHCLAFATSTGNRDNANKNGRYDIYSANWGAGIPASLIDLDAFEAMMRQHPGDIAYRYVLGWGNETVDIWPWMKQALLRSRNYVVVPGDDGRLRPVKFRALAQRDAQQLVDSRASALIAPTTLDGDYRNDQARTRLQGVWGKLPFFGGEPVTSEKYATRGEFLQREKKQEFDYTVYASADLAQDDLDAKINVRDSLPPLLEFEALIEHTKVTPEGVAGGEVPQVGQWVRLLGGPGRGIEGYDGQLFQLDDEPVRATGRIESRDVDLDKGSVRLSVLMLGWAGRNPTRVVAPVAQLDGTTGTDGGGRPYVGYTGELPSADAADEPGFLSGDDVRLHQKNGREWYVDEQRSVVEVDEANSRIVLDQSFSDVESGLLLRCAKEPNFSNTSWGGSSFFGGDLADRRYAYVSVTTEEPDAYAR